MAGIKDKELLTFSNLTNLEWQFIETEKNDDGEYPILKELLIPENFAKKDEEGKRKEFIYGNINVRNKIDCDHEKGLEEMREAAGIGMEYSDFSTRTSQEGYFLNEWEVESAMNNEYLIVNNWKSYD